MEFPAFEDLHKKQDSRRPERGKESIGKGEEWMLRWESSCPFLVETILISHRVDDLPAQDASPAIKLFIQTIELLISHNTATPMAPHCNLLPVVVGPCSNTHASFE